MTTECDSDKIVTMSSPGKILVAGGYLVLESPNVGIVIAADKRFYSTVTCLPTPSQVTDEVDVSSVEDASLYSERTVVDVHSPQYATVFSYHLLYNTSSQAETDKADPLVKLVPRNNDQASNTFIERTLLLALSYILVSSSSSAVTLPPCLGIKLRADNDFYSQVSTLQRSLDRPPTPADVASLPPFLPAGEHKTGLGSSAALVTSLVASLLRYFGVDDDDDATTTTTCTHNLAQTAHSLAQGKIGSGFDVSAAVYGSQVYSRFSPAVLAPMLHDFDDAGSTTTDGAFASRLRACVHHTAGWDGTRTPFSLPPGFEIVMADVCGGSESPSMARKVLRWRREYVRNDTGARAEDDDDDDDDDYWEALRKINLELRSLFTELHQATTTDHDAAVSLRTTLASTTVDAWDARPSSALAQRVIAVREALLESRSSLKALGEVAGVPIEPDAQTALADATMDVPGVVAAGVPGAGGVDALFCLYVRGEDTAGGASDTVRDRVAALWGGWQGEDNDGDEQDATVVCPMGVRAVGAGGGLREEEEMTW